VMNLKPKQRVGQVVPLEENTLSKPHRYRTRSLPAAGSTMTADEIGEQLTLVETL